MSDLPSASGARLLDARLAARRASKGPVLLEFEVESGGEPARLPAPGQFYQVRCGTGREHVLRRPLSAYGARIERNVLHLEFLVDVVGWGTESLSLLEPGETVSVLGPLGRGFETGGTTRALLVAGGIGAAPLAFLARELEGAGVDYRFLAGFKSEADACPGLDELSGAVDLYTEDGSLGSPGVACDGIEGCLGAGFDAAYVCGPEAMMAAAASLCEGGGISCQVSLDARMACGIGACRSCVKEGVGGRNLCVCAEGPVFDSRDIAWKKRNTGSGRVLQ